MYFLNLGATSLSRLVGPIRPETLEKVKTFLSEAEIYYSFEADVLLYQALHRDGRTLRFRLLPSKQIQADTAEDKAFAYLLGLKESSLSLEQLSALYGQDAEGLLPVARLDIREARSYGEAQGEIDALVKTLWTQKSQPSFTGEYQIEWLLSRRGDEFRIDARLGKEKLFINRALATFLDAYSEQRLIKIGGEYVRLSPQSFSEKTEEAFAFLRRHCLANHRYDAAIFLSIERTVDFLFLIGQAPLRIEERSVLVTKPEAISIRYDGKDIVPSLPLDPGGYAIVHGLRGYYFGDRRAVPLSFPSEKVGLLFSFLAKRPDFDFSLVQKKLIHDVLPLLEESDISMPEHIAAVAYANKPRVDCYVSLDEKKGIFTKAVYRFGENEVDQSVFESSSLGRGLSLSFHRALIGASLVENEYVHEEKNIVAFLKKDLSELSATCRLYLDEALKLSKRKTLEDIRIEASSEEDWLSLSLFSNGYSPDELLAAYAAYCKKKRFVRIKGRLVLLEGNESFSRISESFSPGDFGVRLPLYQALKLSGYAEAPEEAKNLFRALTSYSGLDLPSLPAPIEEAARPYQRDGIRFLLNLHRLHMPGILSDEMGLGKTLEAIALFSQIEDDLPILVVCPKSLLYNWADEVRHWAPELRCHCIEGNKKNRLALYEAMPGQGKAAYFISYDTLRNDVEDLLGKEFSLLVLDEGQYIANAFAKKSQAVKQLKAKSRLVLTGTPVQNSLLDLWSIFDFLLPGYLPPYNDFKTAFGALEFKDEAAKKRLLSKIEPFMLGRKKKDVLTELPDKESRVVSLPLSESQREIYEAELLIARNAMKEGQGAMVLLSALTRLRQICITPGLYLEGEFDSDKLDYLSDHCKALKDNGRKAVIFSSFVGALHILEKRLKDDRLITATIEGSTSAQIRVNLAKRFNESDDIDVLLVSLKAGGTGLNLIGADTVFHLDPWWNLSAERQAEDRTHRLGQKNKVTVYKLVCKDTVEEKVLSLQRKKGLLLEAMDEAALGRALTEEDIAYLLS